MTIHGKPTDINSIYRYQELFIVELKTSYRRQNMEISVFYKKSPANIINRFLG